MVGKYASLMAALAAAASAQTFTSCNPMKKTCPNDPALGKSIDIKSFSGTPDNWSEQSNGVSYANGEAQFTITKHGDAPTLISNFYIFWGSVSVVMKASPGTGIVSSVVLESDDLDEIDWEWLGGDAAQVQTNYFGKGDTTTYDRGAYEQIATPQTTYHNYTINWSQEMTQWIIDGAVVRTLNFGNANGGNNYPQTPMKIKIGSWAGGDPGNAPGTIQWAGGKTSYSNGPFTMQVKAITVTDGSSGSAYQYSDNTGSWKSIKVLQGKAAAASASGVSIGSPSPTQGGTALPSGTGTSNSKGNSASNSTITSSAPKATKANGLSTGTHAPSTGAASLVQAGGFTLSGLLAAAFAFAL